MLNGLGGGCQEGRTGGKWRSPFGDWWLRLGPWRGDPKGAGGPLPGAGRQRVAQAQVILPLF